MFAFLIVALSALCSTHANGLSQKINGLHLYAKFGEGLPEYGPETDTLDLVDRHASHVAEKSLKERMPELPFLFKAMYGPIENIVIPGVKLPLPIYLSKIRITGLRGLQLNSLQWRMASNRVMCNATIPFLLIDVTVDNVQIELDNKFGGEELNTNIHLNVRLLDLDVRASARYNVKVMLTDQDLFIDKAEVDITARELVFELKIREGLEEVRYVLSELFNNPIEDIMDAVLKVTVKEINKELLGKMDPNIVTDYLISKVPKNSKVPKEKIVINRM